MEAVEQPTWQQHNWISGIHKALIQLYHTRFCCNIRTLVNRPEINSLLMEFHGNATREWLWLFFGSISRLWQVCSSFYLLPMNYTLDWSVIFTHSVTYALKIKFSLIKVSACCFRAYLMQQFFTLQHMWKLREDLTCQLIGAEWRTRQ